jgi:enoyl-CoA hydratase/carnithine racemase
VVRVIRLTRPAVRNAMDTRLLAALVDALADAAAASDVVGLLVTGGGGHFSAGADLKEAAPLDAADAADPAGVGHGGGGGTATFGRRQELFALAYEQLTTFRAPTVAAVEGWAVGGGAELAAACDLLVVARGARLRFPGAIHGIPVGAARTIGRVGLATARDWVLSARVVDAEEAHASGFAQRLVDDGEAVTAGLAWLEEVASRDAATVAVLKRHFLDLSGLRDRTARENDALLAQARTGRLPSYGEDLPRTVRPRRG